MRIQRKPLPQNSRITPEYLEIPRPRSRSLSPSRSSPVSNPYRTYTNPYNLSIESEEAAAYSGILPFNSRFVSETAYAESPTSYSSQAYEVRGEAWDGIGSNYEEPTYEITSQVEATNFVPESIVRDGNVFYETPVQPETPASSKAKLRLVTALEDTSIFLGGLIKHPVESTRHFTILRHSHGLVYYKGPTTSISISVFSDQPIPSSRRYWLQSKGWTGNTGMTAKAFFRANNNWINVTPDTEAVLSELPSLDERAWQRDIQKFMSKANKYQRKHILRETIVVRIPYEANDGYFRIVVTGSDSRQVLCPSPVFRIASTSMSASSLKGASLVALPLELGLKAAQFAAKTTLQTTVAPLATTVQNQIKSAVPFGQYSGSAQTAWNISGMSNRVDNTNERYSEREAIPEAQEQLIATRTNSTGLSSVLSEDGPGTPFPIQLKGVVAQGTSESTKRLGRPTANLDTIAPDLLAPLGAGHYLGWAFVSARDKDQIDAHSDWRPAIITILHKQSSAPQIAQRKVVRTHVIHDFSPNTSFVGAELSLLVMGFLRPLSQSPDADVDLLEIVNDVTITREILSRPAWNHQETLRRVKTAQSTRSMTDKLVDMRAVGQRHVDRVPIHMLGVRSNSAGVHDRGMYGNGGFWVKRD